MCTTLLWVDPTFLDEIQREISALHPLAETQRYTAGQISEGMFDPIDSGQPVPDQTHHHSHGSGVANGAVVGEGWGRWC